MCRDLFGQDECTGACPRGSYGNLVAQVDSSNCILCPPGTYFQGDAGFIALLIYIEKELIVFHFAHCVLLAPIVILLEIQIRTVHLVEVIKLAN